MRSSSPKCLPVEKAAKHASQWDQKKRSWLRSSCMFHKYFADLSWLNVRMRPRHSHSLHHRFSFQGKDMYLCTVQVGVLCMIQVQMVRDSAWHFRAYSSLGLFLLCSETKGFSEDDKGSFRNNRLLSDIVVCRFPRWNQANDYKIQNVFSSSSTWSSWSSQ